MDNPIKVMVVEDDKDFLYTIGYWLKSKGYNVVTANNGLEAVETIKKEPVDIVFLDLHMPVMDGVEALKNIRKINKNLPVIIITAFATDERISEAEKYGISGFFSKDKDFSESVTLIETILRVHRGLKKE
jgi:CheY-like chemotaxis protein